MKTPFTEPVHTLTRLYLDHKISGQPSLPLDQKQAFYLSKVMRLGPGDQLRTFNGYEGEWLCKIVSLSNKDCTVQPLEQLRSPENEPLLVLCCAPIKKAHFEYMIEKSTELGVTVIQPLLTSRTQIRTVNIERCRDIAIEASEQSERLSLPTINPPLELEAFIKTWPSQDLLVVCAEWGNAEPIGAALQSVNFAAPQACAIVTGPEGGFSAEELERLRSTKNHAFVRLGTRILRADTAAIAALSLWQALKGDWEKVGSRPGSKK